MVLCLPRVNDDQSEIQRLKLSQNFFYDRFKSIYSNVTEVDGISGTDQTVCSKGCCSTVTLAIRWPSAEMYYLVRPNLALLTAVS